MDMQKAIRADFFESLSVDVPHYITSKRTKKSVDTSLVWLDQSIKLQEKESTIFGVIQGGNDLAQRTHSAKETNKRNVAGFVLGSLGLGETQEQRATIVKTILVSSK
jgi:tRNA-guanine family transglycosylase